ncbi:MAG: nuclear transport factor 2 family protein [Chloroflexota bacterium]|nr:nuclear transport factor 2 family protein [Chloroflexota bacterium]
MTIEMAWTAEEVEETVSPDDAAAIRSCLLDYFEGWFDGDAERMDRALHPGLAKHALGQDRARSEVLDVDTKDTMVKATREGQGRRQDVPDRAIRIDVLGVSGDIACAVVHSAIYVEYSLLARTRDGWRITGTLWRWATGHGPRA